MVLAVGDGIKRGGDTIKDNGVWSALAGTSQFPTEAEIVWKTGMQAADVRAALLDLERRGLVTPVRRADEQSVRYKLLPGPNPNEHEASNASQQSEVPVTDSAVWKALALSTPALSAEEISSWTRVSGEQVEAELNALRAGSIATRVEFPDGRIGFKLLPKYDHDAPAAAAKKDSR